VQPRSLIATAVMSMGAGGAIAAIAWAGLTPIQSPSRNAIFEIPQGTWARRVSGENVDILPNQIRLTLGIQDVLLLRNLDDVPQIFGPTLMMPGQGFSQPFAQASEYQFACTAHASGQTTVIVEPNPVTAWARIVWRVRGLLPGPL
jgi:hypothetical protein